MDFLVRGHDLSVLQPAARFEISGDAGGAEGMAADGRLRGFPHEHQRS